MSYTYLALPYADEEALVRRGRYREAVKCLHWLLERRIWTFCPIVHCHHLAEEFELPKDWDYWWEYDMAMLHLADRLLILALPGWQSSRGVTEEANFCRSNHITINFITPPTYRITDETPRT